MATRVNWQVRHGSQSLALLHRDNTPMGDTDTPLSYAQRCIADYETVDQWTAIPAIACINIAVWIYYKHASYAARKLPVQTFFAYFILACLDGILAIACMRLFKCVLWTEETPRGLKVLVNVLTAVAYVVIKHVVWAHSTEVYTTVYKHCDHDWLRDPALPSEAYKLDAATVRAMMEANHGEFPHRAMLAEFMAVANSDARYRVPEHVAALRVQVVRRYSRYS
jgi:hypothetical protein